MKKILALVIAALLVVASMSALATVSAGADDSITITGLAAGDTVNLYRVLSWNTTTGGWVVADAFKDLVDSGKTDYSANFKKLVDNDTSFSELTKEDVEKIAKLAKAPGASAINSAVVAAGATSYTYSTFSSDADLGLFIALVEPADVNTVYNPIIVSADFTSGGTNAIDSSETMGNSSVAKKETITLDKEQSDITLDAGGFVRFTVTTTIPAYSASYVNPTFTLHDKMSTGLELDIDATTDPKHEFTVECGGISYTGTPADGAKEFTLVFNSDEIAAKVAETPVTVTYWAKLTNEAPYSVNEETNDVDVEFSNNPKDDTSHSHLIDEAKEYTFTIDGTLFGHSDYTNGEIVKVGLNKDGSIAESYVALDNGSEHAALAGAEFGVYTKKADADLANTNYYTNAVFNGTVTTTGDGLMLIPGLAEGTYYLKELSAPAGYIKDPETHSFTISCTWKNDAVVSQTFQPCGHTVTRNDIKVLQSYTVSFDGNPNSSYTMDLSGPSISNVEPGDSSSEIVNTKGVELPSTGGVGTTIFYVGGGILVLLAVVFLVTKRRMSAND